MKFSSSRRERLRRESGQQDKLMRFRKPGLRDFLWAAGILAGLTYLYYRPHALGGAGVVMRAETPWIVRHPGYWIPVIIGGCSAWYGLCTIKRARS